MKFRTPLRHALVTAAVAISAAGLLTAAPAVAGEIDGPSYHQPTVGECRNVSLQELYQQSNAEDPVDCSQKHTARVIAVVRVPDAVAWDDQAKLVQLMTRRCLPAKAEALGRTTKVRDLSAYVWSWFVPTAAERSHGARWIRCDLMLLGGDAALPLPTDAAPALGSGRLPDKVAQCLLGAEQAYVTTCARRHHWRASGAFVMDQKAHPTARQARRAAIKRCPRMVTTNTFRWNYQSRNVWKAGDHVVVCYSKTRR